jgi:hypothetical protein
MTFPRPGWPVRLAIAVGMVLAGVVMWWLD